MNNMIRVVFGLGVCACVITAFVMTCSLWSFIGLFFLIPLVQCDCGEEECEVNNDNRPRAA